MSWAQVHAAIATFSHYVLTGLVVPGMMGHPAVFAVVLLAQVRGGLHLTCIGYR